MPIDGKYGQVTLEHGAHIPADEPVFVFRANDRLLPKVLDAYYQLCEEAGSPERHLKLIASTHDQLLIWQKAHPPKTPDSESSRAWLPE